MKRPIHAASPYVLTSQIAEVEQWTPVVDDDGAGHGQVRHRCPHRRDRLRGRNSDDRSGGPAADELELRQTGDDWWKDNWTTEQSRAFACHSFVVDLESAGSAAPWFSFTEPALNRRGSLSGLGDGTGVDLGGPATPAPGCC